MPEKIRPLTWKRVVWAWKLFRAGRAEIDGDWETGLRLVDEAAQMNDLWAYHRVLRAVLLVRSQRMAEAQLAFVALWNEFEGSDNPDHQYLQAYCKATLEAIWENPSLSVDCPEHSPSSLLNRAIRERFPIPDLDVWSVAGKRLT